MVVAGEIRYVLDLCCIGDAAVIDALLTPKLAPLFVGIGNFRYACMVAVNMAACKDVSRSRLLLLFIHLRTGAGMVLYDCATHSEVWCGWKYLGDMAGHNIAEYTGLLVGLQCAKALGVTKIVVEGDSEFVIRQLEGRYQARDETFISMHRRCIKELDGFEGFEVRCIPRMENKRADELANQAMDTEESWGIVTNHAETYGKTPIGDDSIDEEHPTLLSLDDTGLNTESPIDPEKTYLLQFDGGSRGNPGRCRFSLVSIVQERGKSMTMLTSTRFLGRKKWSRCGVVRHRNKCRGLVWMEVSWRDRDE